jgi:phosphoadenosine phosphosulfate reductase
MSIAPIGCASELEALSPGEIVAWAGREFGSGLVVTASFGDAVLAHLVSQHAPEAEVVLIDTQYLFAETRWYAEKVSRRLRLNLNVVRPDGAVVPDDQWEHDTDGCCHARKVEPLNRALAGKRAWISGLRRADSPARADAPVIAWDDDRQLFKINPLVAMSDEDVDRYNADHHLPRHPLADKGYPSIGCWPCTRPVAPGEDARSGRWAGDAKTECGLHLPSSPERRAS